MQSSDAVLRSRSKHRALPGQQSQKKTDHLRLQPTAPKKKKERTKWPGGFGGGGAGAERGTVTRQPRHAHPSIVANVYTCRSPERAQY